MITEDGYTFLYTVKDLKEYLCDIPDDTKLKAIDADIGGYDCIEHPFINPVHKDDCLYLGHEENNAWENNQDIYDKYFD